MANENRLKILKILGQGKVLTVGDLAEEIHLSYKATQKHLTMFYHAGLVSSRRDRYNVSYFLADINDQFIKTLINVLLK